MEWISVEDTLPPKRKGKSESIHVLTCIADQKHSVVVGSYDFENECWEDSVEGWSGNMGHVTHWMCLPKVPNK